MSNCESPRLNPWAFTIFIWLPKRFLISLIVISVLIFIIGIECYYLLKIRFGIMTLSIVIGGIGIAGALIYNILEIVL
ncbi:hypothetical protein BK784_26600 [Bacillus thuringiensis serovar medellin]|uniref:Uncharacterized protein n=2 Tax=Bacillus cereus group TaxID=86661 RepID=A0A2B9DNB2_BACCE|nr:hypothetical protein BK784_26600 [Bacillus thuringiensis serovar medellin]PGM89057.1 hypothetical protein CN958_25370 [Bacillus cereus]PGS78921.1 hypothetical protein COC69_13675 [Bacillus cereus]